MFINNHGVLQWLLQHVKTVRVCKDDIPFRMQHRYGLTGVTQNFRTNFRLGAHCSSCRRIIRDYDITAIGWDTSILPT